MTDFASLLVQVQRRYTEFLAQQSNDDLLALAEGRLRFALVDPAVPVVEPSLVAPAPPVALAADEPPAPKLTRTRRAPAPRTSPTTARKGKAAAPKAAIDPAGVAARLREFDSVDDGLAYLDGLKPLVADLKLIGQELNLALSGTKAQMMQKILTQAIGARRKFAGLRTW